MTGAFQTSREIFENAIWLNIVEFRLFFLIYGKAAFKDGVKVGNIELKRGQWIRSIRNLQYDLEYKENRSMKKYSLSTIFRAINGLISDERIKVFKCELGTLFEVMNYAKYQGLSNYKHNIENAERTDSERNENATRTQSEQPRNNNNNALSISNKDNKKICTELDEFFEKIWSLYPKKLGKADIKSAKKKELFKIGYDEMARVIERYKTATANDDPKYIKHGSTFFNGGYIDFLDANYVPEQPKSLYRNLMEN